MACSLAKQGVRVAVVKKTPLPCYKTCSGGVVHRAVRLLPVDIREAVERQCYIAELHLLQGNLRFSARRKTPIISMTMRDKLDALLLDHAEQAGA